MKCTIKKISNIELKNNCVGSRVEGFVPLNLQLPDYIKSWIKGYCGVKVVVYEDGIFVASWAEAKCSEHDSYEALTGKHLAESRAKSKLYKFLKNLSMLLVCYFAGLVDDFEMDYEKYSYCVEHESRHTNYLIHGEE